MSDPTASPKPPPPPPPPPSIGTERRGDGDDGQAQPDAISVGMLADSNPPTITPAVTPSVSQAEKPSELDGAEAPTEDLPIVVPGRMRAPWRVALSIAWGVAILALSSVWQVSVQIGHNTWWLGPAGEPNNLIVQLLPFFGPVIVLFLVIINVKGLSWWASLFALGQIAIGAFDLPVYRNLGLLEMLIGALLLVISLASTAGRIRKSTQPST